MAAVTVLGCSEAHLDGDSIQVVENGAFELTVPQSKVVLTIPRGNLVRTVTPHGGAADNPRYFIFEDTESGLKISGWFEPEERFTSVKQIWENDKAGWIRRGLGEPKEIAWFTSGEWKALSYGMPAPDGIQVNIRAHWVGNGTWIDLHLSMICSDKKSDPKPMFDLFDAIKVIPKK